MRYWGLHAESSRTAAVTVCKYNKAIAKIKGHLAS